MEHTPQFVPFFSELLEPHHQIEVSSIPMF